MCVLKWDLMAITPNDFIELILRRLPIDSLRINIIKKHAHTFIAMCYTGKQKTFISILWNSILVLIRKRRMNFNYISFCLLAVPNFHFSFYIFIYLWNLFWKFGLLDIAKTLLLHPFLTQVWSKSSVNYLFW